jgi:hypothetical protein
MSASGHLQTFAGSKRMSALPSKADILALLELRQLRAVGGLVRRSKEALFDDLVSAGEECRRQIMHNLLRSRNASRSVFASDGTNDRLGGLPRGTIDATT